MFLITPQLNEEMLDWADELIEPWCIKAIKPSFFQERDYPLTKLAAKVMNPERKLRSVKRLHRPLSSRQWNKKKYNRDVSDDETNVKQHESDRQNYPELGSHFQNLKALTPRARSNV
ncbi:hypothetical protein BgiBS90_008157 [Biomphalaria glabrata]|nr:hypothetical protein BgiBS90_008157 [Biomphalaria glabrata]